MVRGRSDIVAALMPNRPPIHRPPGYKPERVRLAELRKRSDTARPSPRERGYDAAWEAARAAYLRDHPLCECGCGAAATDVNHKLDVAVRPDLRLDPRNFEALAHGHHSAHTARTRGFGKATRPVQGQRSNPTERASLHPDWLRPSTVPLTIVCGPPAAGKSTYVANKANRGDVVIELDRIVASLSGTEIVSAAWDRPTWLNAAIRQRNLRLADCGRSSCRAPGAWLVIGEPTAEWRQWWADKIKPVRIVVIATPLDVCLDRLRRRVDLVPDALGAAHRWWEQYRPRAGDVVVSPANQARTERQGGS